jgi:hypothetical protein
MRTFEIELFEGHPIIRDGDNTILLDTGAPSTIHISDQLQFLGESYRTTSNYMGLTINKLSDLLGMQITTLLGADVLSKYKLLLNYKEKQVSFSKEAIELPGLLTCIDTMMGIPIITANVGGNSVKCFLDTGAKLSYVSDDITKKYNSNRTADDFYPGVGKFTTKCFDIETTFGNSSFNIEFGNLPPLLQTTLLIAGTDGILGYDFFDKHTIMLDLQKKELKTVVNDHKYIIATH